MPRFTIQVSGGAGRRWIGAGALLIAFAFMAAGVSALGGSTPHSLVPLGLGRLVDAAADRGWGIAPLLSTLENFHLAFCWGLFGTLLAFGATPLPAALPGELLLLLRRAEPRIHTPLLLLGLTLVGGGLYCGAAGHPVIAGLIETLGLSAIGWSSWRMLIPEARPMIAVVFDPDLAFGSRVEISGGVFNRRGRLTIRHDQFLGAATLEPLWPRIVGTAHLRIDYRDARGGRASLLIKGCAPLAECAAIAAYLNSAFIRGLPRTAFQAAVPPWRLGDLIPPARGT